MMRQEIPELVSQQKKWFNNVVQTKTSLWDSQNPVKKVQDLRQAQSWEKLHWNGRAVSLYLHELFRQASPTQCPKRTSSFGLLPQGDTGGSSNALLVWRAAQGVRHLRPTLQKCEKESFKLKQKDAKKQQKAYKIAKLTVKGKCKNKYRIL